MQAKKKAGITHFLFAHQYNAREPLPAPAVVDSVVKQNETTETGHLQSSEHRAAPSRLTLTGVRI